MENTSAQGKNSLIDLRQTQEYASFLSQIGWTVEHIHGNYYYIKTIPFIGSAIKLQRVDKINKNDIEKLSKKYRAFQIILEPNKASILLKNSAFKLSKNPYLPTKTLRINVKLSDEKIIEQMKKDGRYSLRKSAQEMVFEERDILEFRKSWFAVVKHKRHVLPISHLNAFKAAFKDNMVLYVNKEKTAGGMFLKTKDITYYWIGFTSDAARDSLVQYQIIWKGILWGKKRGAKVFDFEGIYDDRFPIKGWQGFTHFKKSFGGEEISYPGCFIKWRMPF